MLHALVPQLIGGDQQLLVIPLHVGGGHVPEQGGGVLADLRPGGHQAQVCVLLGGLFVVVAGAHLGDVLDLALVPAGDEAHLGVDLDVLSPVQNGAARLLHALGPLDVVLLVKAGPQLHEGGDLLAVLGGGAQVLGQLGLGGQAVDGDFDGQHVRVGGGLPHQVQEGVHGLEGVKQQHVVVEHLGQHLLLRPEEVAGLGGVGGIAQGGLALGGQLALQGEDVLHAQGGLGEEHLLPGEVQLPAQKVNGPVVPAALELQTHRGQAVALFHDLPHVLAEVLVHLVGLVLGADVRVPGHRGHRFPLHVEGGEQALGVLGDHVLGENVAQPPFPEGEVGGQALGHGNEPQELLALALQAQDHVQGLVGQVGEGVAGIHHLGGEDGTHLILEPVLHLLALLGVHLVHGHAADVAGPQAALQLLHHLVPLLVQGSHRLENGLELLLRGLAGAAVDVLLLHQGHVVQGAHPDHEELVQVAGEDGGELEPLHQGDALVLGLLQHPLVEAQPGQLPVLGISGIYFFCHSFYSLSFMWMA